ncbi:MAG: hypothetical protein ACLFP8_04915 [Alphaproteobacteria bacterium]
MSDYNAKYGAFEAARSVRFFIKTHYSQFVKIFLPFIPFILVLNLGDVLYGIFQSLSPQERVLVGNMISDVFFMALTLSWYQFVVTGKNHFRLGNIFEIEKHEVHFFIINIFFIALFWGFRWVFLFLLDMIGLNLGELIPFVLVWFITTYIYCRVSFYFVSVAVGDTFSFREAFALGRPYTLRIIFAWFLAAVRLFVLMYAVIFILQGLIMLIVLINADAPLDALSLMSIMGSMLKGDFLVEAHLGDLISRVVSSLYFIPLLTVINAGVIANYYLYALQNRN